MVVLVARNAAGAADHGADRLADRPIIGGPLRRTSDMVRDSTWVTAVNDGPRGRVALPGTNASRPPGRPTGGAALLPPGCTLTRCPIRSSTPSSNANVASSSGRSPTGSSPVGESSTATWRHPAAAARSHRPGRNHHPQARPQGPTRPRTRRDRVHIAVPRRRRVGNACAPTGPNAAQGAPSHRTRPSAPRNR